jgi:hypothetical protein
MKLKTNKNYKKKLRKKIENQKKEDRGEKKNTWQIKIE